jgi:3-mercaptopyruvate sulfurtransferase SseA
MNYVGRCLFLIVVLLTACSTTDQQSGTGLIVSSEWLQEQLNDPALVVLHVGTSEGYDSLHIEGARFIDPYDFTVETEDLRNELPGLDSVMDLLVEAGVNADSRIVLCFESGDLITRTARVFLTLDFAGWGERTHVLNGGLPGWSEKGLSTSTGSEESVSVSLERLNGEQKSVTIFARELKQQRWNSDYVIIDVRSADEYYGEIDSTEMKGIRGHVEGANFLDYHRLLSDVETDLIREDEELQSEFTKAGMDYNKTAVFYCGSGVRASLSYLVAQHLGYPALLYDGSIEEWEMLELPLTSPVMDPTKMK